ncbi:MAG: alpha/beta hydrolase family protein [Gammaproteobacteria bacterium]|nr:alpha/beta hydrolase family protein [Gammaproteobacteria bacterium]MDH5594077.1 alpha/beta hydrolase family protein [Gammaproteobacteria bacterium]
MTHLIKNTLVIWLLAGILSFPAISAAQEEKPAEKEAEKTEPLPKLFEKGIQIGKPIWIQSGEDKIFAIYTQETHGNTQGGIILIHDLGQHPDWPDVISPLRTRLPELGWSTLSLQMPVLDANANLKEYGALFDKVPGYIKAAVEYLRTQNIGNVVIIGHGLGAAMGANYLANAGNRSQTGVTGFIGISMSAPENVDKRMHTPSLLEKITAPVFDIYGELDEPSVVQSAQERANAAKRAGILAYKQQSSDGLKDAPVARTSVQQKAGSIAYRQVKISGADHNFNAQITILTKRIRGWLQRHASGKRVQMQ